MMEVVKSPVTEADIRRHTRSEPIRGVVLHRILEGGLERETGESSQPHRQGSTELTTERGGIPWGRRVVIPTSLRAKVLQEFHVVLPGTVRLKAIAPSHVGGPGLDRDIEDAMRRYPTCQGIQCRPTSGTVNPEGNPPGHGRGFTWTMQGQ